MTLYSNCTNPVSMGKFGRPCQYNCRAEAKPNPCIHEPTKRPPLNRVPSTLNVKLGNTTREVIWRIENQDNPALDAVQTVGNLKYFRVAGPCTCRTVHKLPGPHHSSICGACSDTMSPEYRE